MGAGSHQRERTTPFAADRHGQNRIGGDEQAQLSCPADVSKFCRNPVGIRRAEMAIDDAPAGRQAGRRPDRIGRAGGICQEEDRRNPERQVAELAQAASPPPCLVAVSKTQPDEKIDAMLAAGQRVFGENRVQEAQAHWADRRALYPDLELRLIGPLQTNKAEDAVALFDVIETLDREKLARALAKAIAKVGRAPRIFIQVNTGEEPQKAGVTPDGLADLLKVAVGECGLRDGSVRRALERDFDVRIRCQEAQHRAQVRLGEGDAAFGRLVVFAGEMQENRAAAARNDRIVIVAEFHDQVVDMVGAPELFGRGRIGQGDRTIIERVAGRIAPAVIMAKRDFGQARFRRLGAVGPVEQAPRLPDTNG